MTPCQLKRLVAAGLVLSGYFALTAVHADELDKEGVEFFEKRIRPILVEHCYKCHSEKAEQLEGDLYVDSREGLLQGGDQGPAIEPGHPERSLLIQAVKYDTDDLKMPPDKRLDDEQIADLEKWIKIGAPDPRKSVNKPEVGRPKIDIEQARNRWPFRALAEPELPEVKHSPWCNSTVDRFILKKLEEHHLLPADDAEENVLLRRLTFDLIGLPPTPEELSDFLADDRPDAVARVVDRLLASPQYGARWGRHWLDVVRYADTAGDNSDYPIPQMYKYRNWVIAAWNSDLPYDQFIVQQIAGDLLPSDSREEHYEKVIATGYIANARRFGSRVDDYPQHLTIEDTIDNLGRTFLGLTINCTRCHDHKFDPLTNEDYYALYGFFQSTRYPWPGIELEKRQRDFVPLVSEEVIAAANRERAAREEQVKANLKKAEREKNDADRVLKEQTQLLESAKKNAAEPSDSVAKLESETQTAKQRVEVASKELQKAKQESESVKQSPVPYDTAYAVAEGKKIEDVCVQIKGDPERLGEKVRRRFPLVLGGYQLPMDDSSSGRLVLARWLADPKNPLTARVMVNRLWHYHFGRGIVATPSDFGKQGRQPTHPELLDHLALRLVDSGWSLKLMNRRIVLSHVYQTSSKNDREMQGADPRLTDATNETLWHFPPRRLDAESIRDALLLVSGRLDYSSGGPHPFPDQKKWDFTQHKPFRAVYETNRRSVYLMTQRIQRHPYLAIFDGPDTSASTAARVTSTTTLQALYLLNDSFVHERAEDLARRLLREYDQEDQRIQNAFQLAVSRDPSSQELVESRAYLEEMERKLEVTISKPDDRKLHSWTSFARMMLRLNEFVYVD